MEIKIEDHSAEFLALFNQATEAGLEAIGHQASSHAKQNLDGAGGAPKRHDTGLLINSVTYALGGKGAAQASYTADRGGGSGSYSGNAPADGANEKTVYIGTNVKYAVYVHEGHRLPNGGRVDPNRFLKNAIEGHGNEYKQILEDHLRNG
jgi:hypothetical protein